MPLIHFALYFQTDKQEKYRHQRVVNPQQHVLVDLKRADLQLNRRLKKSVIPTAGQADVSHQHSQRRGDDKNDAPGGITSKKTMQMFHFL
jgi:hypothetical protein